MLTQSRLKELLHYNEETGIFTRLKCTALRHKINEEVGVKVKKKQYLKCGIDNKEYLLHRLAFLYMNGNLPTYQVDHKDHNGLNNKWNNLRAVTHFENQQNMSISKRNESGIVGVSFDKSRNKWITQIRANGKSYMKRFNSKFSAIRQRLIWNEEFNFHKNHGKDKI